VPECSLSCPGGTPCPRKGSGAWGSDFFARGYGRGRGWTLALIAAVHTADGRMNKLTAAPTAAAIGLSLL